MRVLLLADTHLGFDMPIRPRVERPRRGPDFFANFHEALAPARSGRVDLVVHGGDLLSRSRVPAWLVSRALEPLLDVADRGVPVVLVLGNHERSHLPFPLLGLHENLHLLTEPRTIRLDIAGRAVAVSGFASVRDDVRGRFPRLVEETGWRQPADLRLLVLHQAIEGARVGPADYCFRSGPDVVGARDLPAGFAAILSGHIHRHQVLTHDLAGRPLPAPVLYPGSIERTSRAERDEEKGYLTIDFDEGRLRQWCFHPLPSRPMVDLEASGPDPLRDLAHRLADVPRRALVRVRIPAGVSLRASALRALAPEGVIVETAPTVERSRAFGLARVRGKPHEPAVALSAPAVRAGPRSRPGRGSSG